MFNIRKAIASSLLLIYGLGITASPFAGMTLALAQDRPYYRVTIPSGGAAPPDPTSLIVSVTPTSQNVFVGQPAAFSTQVTGAHGVTEFSVLADIGSPTALGLSLGVDGTLAGTLTNPGEAVFRIRATDRSNGATGTSAAVMVKAVTPVLTYPPAQSLVEGSDLILGPPSTNIPTPAFSFTGSAPGWLNLNSSTGRIIGTVPDIAADTPLSVSVQAANGSVTAQATATVTLIAAKVTVAGLPAAVQAGNVVSGIATTTLPGTPSWSLLGAPAWLTIHPSTGAISGTAPAGVNATNVVARATSNGASASSGSFSIEVAGTALTITGQPPTFGTVGTPYVAQLAATGGAGGNHYSLSGSGATVDPVTGIVTVPTGIETTAGPLTVTVTDSTGHSVTSPPWSVVVSRPLQWGAVTSSGIAYVGEPVSQSLAFSGGRPPYSIGGRSCGNCTPAEWLSQALVSNGTAGQVTYSGTPATDGWANSGSTKITDADGRTVNGEDNGFQVYQTPSWALAGRTSLNLIAGYASASKLAETNKLYGPVQFSAQGTLPAGLGLDPISGTVTGAAAAAGDYPNIKITLTDAGGRSATTTMTFSVAAGLAIAGTAPQGTVGSAYSFTPAVTGGAGTKSFSATNQAALNALGLAVNATTGSISGTPTAAITWSGNITVTDSTGSKSLGLTIVVDPPLAISGSPPATTVGASYGYSLSTSGGSGTKTFNVIAGTLPAGIILNATTGILSGSATSAGLSHFTVRVADASSSAELAFTITVNAAVSLAYSASTYNMPLGIAFVSPAPTVTGGTGTKAFLQTSGTLPAGLSLDGSTGVLSGTPTVGGSAIIQILVQDRVGISAQQTLTLNVSAPIAAGWATFSTVGTTTWTPIKTPMDVRVMVVGAGAGGGSNADEPGGSGQVRVMTMTITGPVSVTVGAGGPGYTANNTGYPNTSTGGNSSFSNLVASGGNGVAGGSPGGARASQNGAAMNGGSGGYNGNPAPNRAGYNNPFPSFAIFGGQSIGPAPAGPGRLGNPNPNGSCNWGNGGSGGGGGFYIQGSGGDATDGAATVFNATPGGGGRGWGAGGGARAHGYCGAGAAGKGSTGVVYIEWSNQ